MHKKPRASNELSSVRSDIFAGFSCIQRSQALIKQSGDLQTSVTMARSDSRTNQIQLLHSDGIEETTLHIASLPNTVPLRNSSVTFTVSSSADGDKPPLVRTIVTTRPQPTYDSTESRHMRELPLVIRKHCNAIPVSQASFQIEGSRSSDPLELASEIVEDEQRSIRQGPGLEPVNVVLDGGLGRVIEGVGLQDDHL